MRIAEGRKRVVSKNRGIQGYKKNEEKVKKEGKRKRKKKKRKNQEKKRTEVMWRKKKGVKIREEKWKRACKMSKLDKKI